MGIIGGIGQKLEAVAVGTTAFCTKEKTQPKLRLRVEYEIESYGVVATVFTAASSDGVPWPATKKL